MRLFSHNQRQFPILLMNVLIFFAGCANQSFFRVKQEPILREDLKTESPGEKIDKISDQLGQIMRTVKWDLDKSALRLLARNDLAYGEKQFNAREYKTAEFYLDKGLILYPENQRGLKLLAWTHFFQKRYDLALESFKRVRGFYPKDPDPAIGLAWSYFAIKQYQQALDAFSLAEKLKGSPYEISRGRGFCRLALLDEEKAREELSDNFSPKEVLFIISLWHDWTKQFENNILPIVPDDAKTHALLQLPMEYPRHNGSLLAQAIILPNSRLENAWKIYRSGQYRKALKYFESLHRINYPDGANGLAWTLLRLDRFLAAEAIFKDILETHPVFPGAILGLEEAERLKRDKAVYGKYYYDLKKYHIASSHYEELTARFPDWAFPQIQLGNISIVKGNYLDARQRFEVALELDPGNIEALEGMEEVYRNKAPLLLKANQALVEKRFKDASQQYISFLEEPPVDFVTPYVIAEAYNGLGWSYFGKKQYELAIEKFEKALRCPRHEYEAALGLGKIFYIAKDHSNAAKYLAIAERHKPREKDISYKLDWSILQSSSMGKAEKTFTKTIEIYPLRASSYMALGWIYYKKNKPNLAIEYFLRAISLDPDFALTEEFSKVLDGERFGWQIYNRFGWEYFKRKSYDKSIYLFKVALGRKSDSSEALKGIGYNLFRKKQYKQSILFLKQSLALNRNPRPIEEWINDRKAIAPFPVKTGVHSTMGWNYYHIGRYEEARVAFLKEIETHPEWSTVYDGLGWVNLKTNRMRSARMRFQQAIKRQPLNQSAHLGLRTVKQMETEGKFIPQTAEGPSFPKQKPGFSQKNNT